MPEARCPEWGARFYGWALTNPKHPTCPKCGTKLEICEGEEKETSWNRQAPKFC